MYTDEGEPSAGMNKLARDIEGGEDGGPDGLLDRAIMAIAVTEERPAKDIIADTQEVLDTISSWNACLYDANGNPVESEGVCNWEDLGLTMVLTGPVPITNAVTNFRSNSFGIFFRKPSFWSPSDYLYPPPSSSWVDGYSPPSRIQGHRHRWFPTLCAVFGP